MESKNKSININKTEYGILSLIENGILGKFTKLMNEDEAKIAISGKFKDEPSPFTYVFAPSGCEDELQNLKSKDTLELVLNDKKVGYIKVESVYKTKKEIADKSIFLVDTLKANKNLKYGKYAVSGEIRVFDTSLEETKDKIFKKIKNNNLKKISAVMLRANPIHRAHERLIRIMIDKADLVIIFLIRTLSEDKLEFDLRVKTLKYFARKYLPADKIEIVAFENTFFFKDHVDPALECIAAHNFGANKLVVGQNHGGIGMFYDGNTPHTALDIYKKELNIEIIVMPEFVYCNECKCLVSTRSCPHGAHHHIKYRTKTLRDLLYNGIMPPSILMRSDISALILSELFPNRFKDIQKIYDNLFANKGILEKHDEKDFYIALMKLYQTPIMN
ncbi:ATP-sulfurylase family protein [Campylobacter sputorum subsp. bubulus]|uniref:ATP-sulfurylase family protein n=1 Tax=Campylobacter sputorum subsp. sputorum TaxID=32024 RepID=A0A381DHA9_9BACT|nr:sulfate adenylyltransferase [Campylobacter sputorum]ASM35130.1 sulfate adenylyltransferase [Campylobacter sputorum aubsp. sputorum RM3237]QEL05320.1 sulfate adenylyltransferase [Campylobacter sputorum subsp. sputorum]SUX08875.1 ATP-sulfurylase family protein [Campylobacter sputorum subsp. bubulus]SUX09897.1 ATP-sulfurylase family protein [Campylobacter sputorum subsp. sputorum]